MTGNDFVKFFLRTPLYVFMGNTMLITVIGRKTGKKYTTPVGFYRAGDALWIISSRDRTWWRNLQGGAQVEMRLRGKEVAGFAEAILDEEAVAAQVVEYVRHIPMSVRALGVRVENGELNPEDAARLARKRLFVKVKLMGG
jgi:deazaflavin-dependent oxidoreductase (nitroreductase family)